MSRMCIFCSERATSMEHVLPNWLNPILNEETQRRPDSGWVMHMAGNEGVERRCFQKKEIASIKTRQVCHDCNILWMSRLESRAKPVLIPLTEGRTTSLTVNEQILIATWATKTAMVAETTLSRNDRFPKEECSLVMLQDRPPASVEVIATAIEGLIPPLNFSLAQFEGTPNDGGELFQMHFYTLQVGTLVLQIVRRIPPVPNYGTLERVRTPREIDLTPGLAIPIFPPLGVVRWPGSVTLDWEGFVHFCRRGIEMPSGWTPPNPGSPDSHQDPFPEGKPGVSL